MENTRTGLSTLRGLSYRSHIPGYTAIRILMIASSDCQLSAPSSVMNSFASLFLFRTFLVFSPQEVLPRFEYQLCQHDLDLLRTPPHDCQIDSSASVWGAHEKQEPNIASREP